MAKEDDYSSTDYQYALLTSIGVLSDTLERYTDVPRGKISEVLIALANEETVRGYDGRSAALKAIAAGL